MPFYWWAANKGLRARLSTLATQPINSLEIKFTTCEVKAIVKIARLSNAGRKDKIN